MSAREDSRAATRAGSGVEVLRGSGDLLNLVRRLPQRYPFLLESVVHGTAESRFDVLFAFPESTLILARDGLFLDDQPMDGDFFSVLDDRWRHESNQDSLHGLPFRGGWFLVLSYELAATVEPRLSLPAFDGDLPVAMAVRCPAALVRDHQTGEVMAVAERGREDLLGVLRQDWARRDEIPANEPAVDGRGTLSEEPAERFEQSLEQIKRYILDGDVFQVNISRRWDVRTQSTPEDLYDALRRHNPAPFAAFARWKDAAVISSSPERLVQCVDGWVQTRPIAGTRPRDAGSVDGDQALRDELIEHPKERAEHIMLIDLERNDLGRVCVPGTVEVDELMAVESYAHVHHIVSNVRGRQRPDTSPGDVIRAVFPGGTITGCPKVRCMEIIAELEAEGRGPYTGSMGYLNLDGSMDLNILIRTVYWQPGLIQFRAGAGIVADSESDRELAETRSKAKGLLLAIHEADDRDDPGEVSN